MLKRGRLSPQHPVIDRFADVPGLDPFASVEIRNRAGDRQNPVADIGIQGKLGNRRLEEIAAVLAQFQGLVIALGIDLPTHFGQRRARRPHLPFGGDDHFDVDVGNWPLTKVPLDLVVAATASPARIIPITARARPDFEGVSEAEFQGDGPEHGLATIRRADEEDRVVPGSSDYQSPLRHLVSVDDAGGIVAIGGRLRSPGDFVGGLTVQGRQLGFGKGEKIHTASFLHLNA